jgi:uncharacterized protein YjbI with pentapeptide repeats
MTGPARSSESLHVIIWRLFCLIVELKWRRFRRFLDRPWRVSDEARLNADEREAEVFPWMEHTAGAAAVLGAAIAYGLGWAFHLGTTARVFAEVLGLIAGAFGGICLALTWAVPSPGRQSAAAESHRDLWDPWLDADQPLVVLDDAPRVSPIEDPGEPIATRARVRPRVFSPYGNGSMPLEDEVGPFLVTDTPSAIQIVGAPGAGKTTALGHLASIVPPYLRVSFLDEPEPPAVNEALARGWVVFTSNISANPAHFPIAPANRLLLAPWGKDEWIEYLLATDGRLCASVMARLTTTKRETTGLYGIPELWRVVLDRMIADPSITGPRAVLRNELAERLPDVEHRRRIEADCFNAIAIYHRDAIRRAECLRLHSPDEELFRLIRHRPAQLLLAAGHIAGVVKQGERYDSLALTLPRDLVLEAASRISNDPESVDRLHCLIKSSDRRIHPMVASLLYAIGIGYDPEALEHLRSLLSSADVHLAPWHGHAVNVLLARREGSWKPDRPPPRLAGAYLNGAAWPDIDLTGAHMQGVDLSSAVLCGSRLDGAALEGARLARAVLLNSSIEGAKLDGADLSMANLRNVSAGRARFPSAKLVFANLSHADLDRALLVGADLTNAQFTDASLFLADLRSAKLDGAEFFRANLRRVNMRGLCLVGAKFAGACFAGADLSKCDMEGMVLPGARFEQAYLREALLTGSRMPDADFRGADLRAAGLAEVDWEGADLREADLRGAAFHLGSSRSGLVGSPIACEGSRTGFYTDDFNDQDFKSPEEIRKANLRGVDLRGAKIDGVDFYLVDLRGARLDVDQIPHCRGCGAILESRA